MGVRGKTFEYHYSSFPEEVQKALGFKPKMLERTKEATPTLENLGVKELEAMLNQIGDMLNRLKAEIPQPDTDRNFKLTWIEQKLIENYRKISVSNKEIIDDLVEKMAGLNEKKETPQPFEARKVA